MLDEARALLGAAAKSENLFARIAPEAAQSLLDRARTFQNERKKIGWGSVRIIHCWPLFLIDEGLALHLGWARLPSDGYKLAADWAKHYNPHFGTDLNGPSRGKLEELLRFIAAVEELEEER